jgi:hypothetical protein
MVLVRAFTIASWVSDIRNPLKRTHGMSVDESGKKNAACGAPQRVIDTRH